MNTNEKAVGSQHQAASSSKYIHNYCSKLPIQLQNDDFKFVKLSPKTKIPFELNCPIHSLLRVSFL